MSMRTDPFRELDRLTQQVLATASRPAVMAMDAWRAGDEFLVEFDLPGVDPSTVELDVERNVLTVRAQRPVHEGTGEMVAAERPRGVFSRQLILGDSLDTEKIRAEYAAGVLTLRVPVAERAKPRRIASPPTTVRNPSVREGAAVDRVLLPCAGTGANDPVRWSQERIDAEFAGIVSALSASDQGSEPPVVQRHHVALLGRRREPAGPPARSRVPERVVQDRVRHPQRSPPGPARTSAGRRVS